MSFSANVEVVGHVQRVLYFVDANVNSALMRHLFDVGVREDRDFELLELARVDLPLLQRAVALEPDDRPGAAA